jgi:glycosyltransferase involved in cell wall biosynthesis
MLSIVIPAYYEEEAIAEVVSSIQNTLAHLPHEIIVVDDGSKDQTGACALAAGAKVLRHPVNIGYGNALKTGISEAQYPNIMITDADGTYPIDEIPRLYDLYQQGFDMVVGARTGIHYKESLLKNPARIFFNLLAEYVAGQKIQDVNSGFRIFRKDRITPFLPELCGTFSFTTSMTLIAFRQNYFVKYTPVPYYKRKGSSKVKIVRDTLRAAQILVQTILTYNPLKLFLLISIVNLMISLGCLFLYATVLHYWETFVLFLFFLSMAVVSLFFGAIAYTTNQRVRYVWDSRAYSP